jgi:hypothetical protein
MRALLCDCVRLYYPTSHVLSIENRPPRVFARSCCAGGLPFVRSWPRFTSAGDASKLSPFSLWERAG